MKKFVFLFFLILLALVESATSIHLSLAAVLILLNFAKISQIAVWIFVTGFVIDLLSGNFLGTNSLILIIALFGFNLAKNFIWPNITYEVFPKQTVVITILGTIIASRLYGFFYNLLGFGVTHFNLELASIPAEIASSLILFPAIAYLSLHFGPKRQLELKF